MASADVINQIISFTLSSLTYLLPVIGIMSGIIFIVSLLMSITLGAGRRVIKG